MSFDDEFEELAGLAYQMAFRVLGSRAEAEEIAQDTMTKAYVRWRRVQRHARPWVCRVAVNGALGRVRRRGRDEMAVERADRAVSDGVADRVDLHDLLVSLSRRQRDVIALRYLADMSEADVARELGISTGSVKAHAHRGLAHLRARIDTTSSDQSTPRDRKEPTDV